MEAMLMETRTVKSIIGPVDLNTGANTGERIDMKNVKRVTFVITAAAGTTPSSHTVSFEQHTVASAGTPLALTIDNGYYHKVDTATSFTRVAPTGTKASSFDIDSVVGDTKFMAVFEVLAEDLTDGYRWLSLNMTDSGGAQLASVIAIVDHMSHPAYSQVV